MSFRTRYTRSLLAADLLPPQRPDARGRAGYPLWRRYLASLFDIPLAPRNAALPQPQPRLSASTGTAAVPPARPVQKTQRPFIRPVPARAPLAFPAPPAGAPVYGGPASAAPVNKGPASGPPRRRWRPALAMAVVAAAAAAIPVAFLLQTSQNAATVPAPTGSPSSPVVGGTAPTAVSSATGSPPAGPTGDTAVGIVDSPTGWTWLLESPDTSAPHIARLPNGMQVTVLCATHGNTASSTGAKTSDQWYLVDHPGSGYLPALYVRVPTEPTGCP